MDDDKPSVYWIVSPSNQKNQPTAVDRSHCSIDSDWLHNPKVQNKTFTSQFLFFVMEAFLLSPPACRIMHPPALGNSSCWLHPAGDLGSTAVHSAAALLASFCLLVGTNGLVHLDGWKIGSRFTDVYWFIKSFSLENSHLRIHLGGIQHLQTKIEVWWKPKVMPRTPQESGSSGSSPR